ncbi:NG,NG-dimethylarginine dimethylaminohydrolase [Legionella lansingensis]|uniref:NG,NG-dimethylarginine dimethylaminohydrolase n=1 Tax=Legionella lansingensis TaxID=45067 RepID=A0A0W0VTT4_9GAMM|nr:arginine deiminase-related protein [Legionella lansingensis]KTD23579.1 NG,NG-dimethylarginine dimethylaminohydrolase [Legionella lansingensis]SNV52329.1 NG,NG-dimethylarginine dimethylaminohydrolase [Legionella lansingensis]
MFVNAIVRPPAPSLVAGLTTFLELGVPDYDLAIVQHQNYVQALVDCGVEVSVLNPLEAYPDSCFVEDVALLTEKLAILTNPGAKSRQGEVFEIAPILNAFYKDNITRITTPATVDAGDILRIDDHFYIGLSQRTNVEGAQQISQLLTALGFTASTIVLREFLHLKTGVSYLGHGYLLVSGELINHPQFSQFKQLPVVATEIYAANCILVNGIVLMPAGFPKTKKMIQDMGLSVRTLDVSEFRKIDGGLSCLSLRF